jgi:succinyl-CoA synthetase alpha subunit
VDIEDDVSLVQKAFAHPLNGLSEADLAVVSEALGVPSDVVASLISAFNELDAVLVEVNHLVITSDGAVLAADSKIELDDSAGYRQDSIADDEPADVTTELEAAAAAIGLRLIELGGNIAIVANGAGLTMTAMGAVAFAGGRPANFLEIGGDAYTKAVPALELVLQQEGVKSPLVNFCGAFARCDVMTAGVIEAWEALKPDLAIFFSVHGTGQDEARAMLRERLGAEPFERMEDAVAGVSPKKAGTLHEGLPVVGSAVEASAETGIDVSVLFDPAQAVKSSVDDAVDAGAKFIVILTEFVPVHDTRRFVARANEAGTQIIGPNTTGVVTPGETFVGFMPAFDERIFRPGNIGVVSGSGSLGTLACLDLAPAGMGQSAFLGVGGDPVSATSRAQALQELVDDPATEGIVLTGEIGGTKEADAAQIVASTKK